MTLIRLQCPHCEEQNVPSPLDQQNHCEICGRKFDPSYVFHVYADVPQSEFFEYRIRNNMDSFELVKRLIDEIKEHSMTNYALDELMKRLGIDTIN